MISHIKPGGLFILDWPTKEPAPAFADMKVVASHNYGDAQIIFFRA
jgi:hypothetical protein